MINPKKNEEKGENLSQFSIFFFKYLRPKSSLILIAGDVDPTGSIGYGFSDSDSLFVHFSSLSFICMGLRESAIIRVCFSWILYPTG